MKLIDRRYRNIRFVDFIIMFCLTLQSYYFYEIRLAPLPILAVLLLVVCSDKLTNLEFKYLICLIFFCSASIIVGIIHSIVSGISFYINSVIGVLIGVIAHILFRKRFLNRKTELVNTIEIVLWIHVGAFFIQIFGYYLFGANIDFIEPITREYSRKDATGILTNLVIRATGLSIEPATYCMNICSLVFIRLIVSKKSNLVDYVSIATCIISFSVTGIVLSSILTGLKVLFYSKNRIDLFKALLIFSIVFLIIGFFFFDSLQIYYNDRLLNLSEDQSGQERWINGTILFLRESLTTKMLGLGIGYYPYFILYEITSVGSGIQSMFLSWGVLLNSIFILLNAHFLMKSGVKWYNVVVYVSILFGALIITVIPYWILLSGLWLSGDKNEYIHSNK